MSTKTGIEWTDATWNPVTGCSKVSQGCKNCYALRDWARLSANPKTVYHGRAFTDVQTHPERLDQPLRWTRPRRIFVNSMSDLFHESVPFEFIADVFAVMSCTTRHTYQVLTKRPQRMLEFFAWLDEDLDPCFGSPMRVDPSRVWPQWQPYREGKQGGYDNCGPAWPYENVWIGVSVENQAAADERIPLLLQTPAAVRWISAEPLLGPVDLSIGLWMQMDGKIVNQTGRAPRLDWVVAGGESGPKARPSHPDWYRSLRDQCAAAGVPFLFKQWGEWTDDHNAATGLLDQPLPMRLRRTVSRLAIDGTVHPVRGPGPQSYAGIYRVGKKAAGRLLDGVLHDAYPEATR